eukprot:1175971-Prorocentrum_minimum.AAC.1
MASLGTHVRRLVASCCLLEEGAGAFSPGGLVSPALPGASVARGVGFHGVCPVLLDHPSDEGLNSLHCQLASLRGRCEWECGATLGTAPCTIQYRVMYSVLYGILRIVHYTLACNLVKPLVTRPPFRFVTVCGATEQLTCHFPHSGVHMCGEPLAALPLYNEEEVIQISHEGWVPIRFHVSNDGLGDSVKRRRCPTIAKWHAQVHVHLSLPLEGVSWPPFKCHRDTPVCVC